MSTEAKIARQYIRNFPFPCSTFFTEENIESALNFQPRDDDIIISTYPKAGTTWVQYIVFELLNNGAPPPSMVEMRKLMPYMELQGSSAAENLNPPRVLKFHVPYELIPKNPKTKYICIIRNPFDLAVSYFHFLRQITDVSLEFNDFFHAFVEGKCIYGDYFDHILSWYEHRKDENVLILSYERMRRNPRKGLLLVASFLGIEINKNEELIEKTLRHTSFEYMKENVQIIKRGELDLTGHVASSEQKDAVHFFRKGSVGDAKMDLDDAQIKALTEKMEEKLKGRDVMRLWNDITDS